MDKHQPISSREEEIATKIVDAAYTVHKELGPGLLEHVYEICFCHELKKRGLSYRRQVKLPIVYDGIVFEEALRLDVLVEELIICESKRKRRIQHLKLNYCRIYIWRKAIGFLINFHVPVIKQGIQRFVK